MSVQIKRIYESAASDDGNRVLVDRLWPRGVAKADAALDEWYKTVAPTTDLRQWFGHDRDRWDEFSERYRGELDASNDDALAKLQELSKNQTLTLLYAAKDTECNHAVVLKAWLEDNA